MIWILFTIYAAFGQAAKNAVTKHVVATVNKYTVSFASVTSIFIASGALALFRSDSLVPESGFWIPFVITTLLIAISTVLLAKAFQISDLSVVIPLMNFSTVFTLLLSPLFLGEFPGAWQLVGIAAIVFGAYILNIDKSKTNLLTPLKSIFTDKGALLVLIVAAMWGADTITTKIGLQYSDPYTWTAYTRLAAALLYLPFILKLDREFPASVTKNLKWFSLIALFIASSVIVSNITLQYLDASIHSALLRNGTLFGVLFGWIFFKEKNIRERLLGAIIMIGGSLIILFT